VQNHFSAPRTALTDHKQYISSWAYWRIWYSRWFRTDFVERDTCPTFWRVEINTVLFKQWQYYFSARGWRQWRYFQGGYCGQILFPFLVQIHCMLGEFLDKLRQIWKNVSTQCVTRWGCLLRLLAVDINRTRCGYVLFEHVGDHNVQKPMATISYFERTYTYMYTSARLEGLFSGNFAPIRGLLQNAFTTMVCQSQVSDRF